ncbi:hypothetical protein [Dokdonella soli]|uniref:Uncharacterized protein n=1 Tax=Dokdonella soli TaxID=529810 RepID=A0ABN1INL0_9GAMM
MGKRVYGVLLHDQAYIDFAGAIAPFVSEGPIGKYIYCATADTSGQYFRMVVEGKANDDSTFEAEIQIPHGYVKFVIVYPEEKKFGFAGE